MDFRQTVLAIVVALLVHDMIRDAIAGIATLAGELAKSVASLIWK